MAVIAFLVPATLVTLHQAPLDIFNWVGTLAAFGFIVPYVLISVAAPAYLKRLRELTAKDIGVCVASLLLLLIPAVGSVYPVPPAPILYFPYLFLAYIAVGAVWIVFFHRRTPNATGIIRADLETAHGRFRALHGSETPELSGELSGPAV
jgi:amino acid transporter